ncbi:MAG: AAA family ATPase [Bacteroidales bacterium]
MIPIHLSIQGIYSYQEKQSIDFVKLTEAGLFGIFGSVGSGKSTILEAITYALYGKTDRLNISGDNRYYNMMNLKSNELLIEFRFKTGKDDTEYLTTLKSQRNKKQFEEVKSLDRVAYKKVNMQWIPIEVSELETIIGLSYENFKRTIIIPQGKFQEFLQLGNKDRTQMMKELFNLNKYELYFKVVSLETKNNQQIQKYEGQLLQLGNIDPDQIKLIEEVLTQLQNEIKLKYDELILHQEKEKNYNNIKILALKADEAIQVIKILKEKEAYFVLLEKNVKNYEYCNLHFKFLVESEKEITVKIKKLELDILNNKTLLSENINQLKDLENGFESIKKDFDGRELFKQKAEDLVKIAKIKELNHLQKQLNERILNGKVIFNESLEKIDRLDKNKKSIISKIEELNTQYPDMSILSKVRDWFTVNNSLVSNQKVVESELILIQKDIQEIEHQKLLLWENENFAWIPVSVNFTEAASILENKRDELKLLIEKLNSEIEHFIIQSKLEEYATNLIEDKPCPLCGALSHPQPLNTMNISDELSIVRIQKSNFEKHISYIEKTLKRITELNTSIKIKIDLLEKINQKQKDSIEKISVHHKLFCWDTYKDEATVLNEFSKEEQLKLQIKAEESKLGVIIQEIEKEEVNKEKYLKTLETIRHELTANTTESATLSQQIIISSVEEFINSSMEEITIEKDNFLKKYLETETTFIAANNTINILLKKEVSILSRLETMQQTLEEEKTTLKLNAAKLSEELRKSEYKSIKEIEEIIVQNIDVNIERNKVIDFRQSLDYSEKQLSEINKEINGQVYNADHHQMIINTISRISEDLQLKNQNQGKLSNELKELKKDFDSQNAIKELTDKLRLRAEDIKTLKQLFKASGFVNYISSVYLHELCHAANERFYKLTSQKLSIEVTDDNNFQVRDYMNGGKHRNVKTLSGGQTFQAALSLALALADNIQKITDSNQNFFFLDEGFGSLDLESLNIVFDTLKSLRKENRIVGVISHVKEMQQEIDAHLIVNLDEEKGSKIKCSLY